MGESMNGIREAFYSDIIYDYQCKYEDKREKSFLYRAFWAESVSGLLKRLDRSLSEHVTGEDGKSPNPLENYMAPVCPNSRPGSWDYPWQLAKQHLKPTDESQIKEQLAAAMTEHPAWARKQLTKDVPEKGRKERRDFWEELWLKDAAYKAGLITDTEYYLWLVEYLAVRDIYYKDNSIANAHLCLKRLLYRTGVAGIPNTENAANAANAMNTASAANMANSGNPANAANAMSTQHAANMANTGNPANAANAMSTQRATNMANTGNPTNAANAMSTQRAANTANTGNPGNRQQGKDSEDLNIKVNVEKKLAEAAKLIRQERDAGGTEIAARLHNLKRPVKNRKGETIRKEDYLPWLTARLERMALHIKIKTWLQDSGYPLGARNKTEKPPREPRKQDFSLRLFEAYCDSGEGYEFYRKDLSGQENSGDWHMDSQGFCVQALSQADELRESLEQGEGRYLYIPLAVHLGSGCVFFLAGKENYREAYQETKEGLKEAFADAKSCYCFDYLRLNEKYRSQAPGDMGGAFQLQPTFHENHEKSCLDVFHDFKRYCLTGTDSPRRAVKNLNEEAPAGIPDAFRWAFDNLEEMEVSPQAAASFHQVRERAD